MMLTIVNLTNAFPTSHAVKQTQKIKNHQNSINSANILEKMATLSHDVLNDKLINILRSILNLDNKYDAQPKSAIQRMYEDFFKDNQDLPNKSAPNTYVSPHRPYNKTVLPDNHSFEIKVLPQDEDPYSCDYRTRYNQPPNNRFRSITPSNRNNAFYNSHIPNYHSRSITFPQQNSTNKFRNSPRSTTLLPIVNQIVDISQEVFQVPWLDNTMTEDQFLNYCIYFDVGINKTTQVINDTQTNTNRHFPLNVPFKKPTPKTQPKLLESDSLWTPVQPFAF